MSRNKLKQQPEGKAQPGEGGEAKRGEGGGLLEGVHELGGIGEGAVEHNRRRAHEQQQ